MRILILLLFSFFLPLSDILYASEPDVAYFSTSNIAPWGYKTDEAHFDGLLFKLTKHLESESGIQINNQLRPYPRVIQEIKNGTVDFAVMFNSPQAKEIGISIGRVVNPEIILIALKNTPQVTNLDQLSEKYVGFLRGSKYGSAFDNSQTIVKVQLDSMEQGIRMLLKNRLHAVAAAAQTFYFSLKKLNISIDEIKPIMIISETSGDLYFSKASKNLHLIEPFKIALDNLNKKGILNNIFYDNDYMPKQSNHLNLN